MLPGFIMNRWICMVHPSSVATAWALAHLLQPKSWLNTEWGTPRATELSNVCMVDWMMVTSWGDQNLGWSLNVLLFSCRKNRKICWCLYFFASNVKGIYVVLIGIVAFGNISTASSIEFRANAWLTMAHCWWQGNMGVLENNHLVIRGLQLHKTQFAKVTDGNLFFFSDWTCPSVFFESSFFLGTIMSLTSCCHIDYWSCKYIDMQHLAFLAAKCWDLMSKPWIGVTQTIPS